ncbi:hypothetical protein E1B28_007883 [Marasmius oreades]|uniref:Uncharacterized protein n=1 Tax=Marasmius oreades TaxID=181124 RepID=A0A9P7UW04_9AGAR|nr:uncharacterized protein E1B28_007883 [Marasmius oreades]KAG7094279.1 hypothetical protein E1B28_007883 [Marasmius oreades]
MDAYLAAAVLGFSLTCIDAYFTRQGERDFWKSPINLIHSPVHWLYLLSRYFAIVVHICNIIIASIWKYQYTAIPHNVCYAHLIFEVCMTLFSLAIVDAILMLRVYALYNKSQEMASFLGLVLLLKLTTAVWGLARLLPNSTTPVHFTSICIPSVQLLEEPGLALFMYIIFNAVALAKSLSTHATHYSDWAKWPYTDFSPRPATLTSVLNRDALSVFVAICGA